MNPAAVLAAGAVARGTAGVVAAGARTAAVIGAAALIDGGNAFDAVIAAGLAETVLLPPKCGLAGDVIALVQRPGWPAPRALLSIGAAAHDLARAVRSRPLPVTGGLSVGVPGAPAGYGALAALGRLGRERLAAPAVALAERGVPWSSLCAALAAEADALLMEHQPLGCRYRPISGPLPEGAGLRLPGLAALLREFALRGADLFAGPVGAALVARVQAAGGVITLGDLARPVAEWSDALTAVVEARPRDAMVTASSPAGTAAVSPPEGTARFPGGIWAVPGGNARPVPDGGWLVPDGNARPVSDGGWSVPDGDARSVPGGDARSVRLWVTPGPTYGPALLGTLAPSRAGLAEAAACALRELREGRDLAGALPEGTSAVAAADAEGNAVVMVHSNSHPQFGSGLVVEPYDLVLSNRAGRGFSPEPGHPNAPAPGRRPYTTLHAWALDSGGTGRADLFGATPGGEQQVAWNAQVISDLLTEGPDALGEILTRPRWSLSPTGPITADTPTTAIRPAHVIVRTAPSHRGDARPLTDESADGVATAVDPADVVARTGSARGGDAGSPTASRVKARLAEAAGSEARGVGLLVAGADPRIGATAVGV